MVKPTDVSRLSESIDALIEKYGKASGAATATARAKLLGKAEDLRASLDAAIKKMPPSVEKGVAVTKAAATVAKDTATAARDAAAADLVPIAIAALSTALEVISEKSKQVKTRLDAGLDAAAETAKEAAAQASAAVADAEKALDSARAAVTAEPRATSDEAPTPAAKKRHGLGALWIIAPLLGAAAAFVVYALTTDGDWIEPEFETSDDAGEDLGPDAAE